MKNEKKVIKRWFILFIIFTQFVFFTVVISNFNIPQNGFVKGLVYFAILLFSTWSAISIYSLLIGDTIPIKRKFVYSVNPSNTLKMVFTLIVFLSSFFVIAYYSISNHQIKEIIIAGFTGIIASLVTTMFLELSKNYENNCMRLTAIDEYLMLLNEYDNLIDDQVEKVKLLSEHKYLEIVDIDKLKKKMEKSKSSLYLPNFVKNNGVEIQAIARVIAEYGDIFKRTIRQYAYFLNDYELRMLQEIVDTISVLENYAFGFFEAELDNIFPKKPSNIKSPNYLEEMISYKEKVVSREEIVLELYSAVLNDISAIDDKEDLYSVIVLLTRIDGLVRRLKTNTNYLKDTKSKYQRYYLSNTSWVFSNAVKDDKDGIKD